LVAGFVLTFLARPLSVLICALPFRYGLREQTFLSWAGLRGAVPIVLATIPLSAGVPGSSRIFDIVFLLVVIYTLVQGPTLPLVASRLKLTEVMTTHELSVDAASLDGMNADLLQFEVPEESAMRGVTIDELRLPTSATVSLVVRDNHSWMPTRDLRLHGGDQLLIVATGDVRDVVESRLRAVNTSGRLARWLSPDGPRTRRSRWQRLQARWQRR